MDFIIRREKSNKLWFCSDFEGRAHGLGKIYETDVQHYKDPRYQRTLEVSREQYDVMKLYAETMRIKGDSTPSSLTYDGTYNSCIDFSWRVLIHRTLPLPNHQYAPMPRFEGDITVRDNKQRSL